MARWADSFITSPSWPVRVSWPSPSIRLASTNMISPPYGVQAKPRATPGKVNLSDTYTHTQKKDLHEWGEQTGGRITVVLCSITTVCVPCSHLQLEQRRAQDVLQGHVINDDGQLRGGRPVWTHTHTHTKSEEWINKNILKTFFFSLTFIHVCDLELLTVVAKVSCGVCCSYKKKTKSLP